jgi:NIMA (never in mitosis gene a)-related kinase 2
MELQERIDWCVEREEGLEEEERRLEQVREDLESRQKNSKEGKSVVRKDKPLEDVQNIVTHPSPSKPPTSLRRHPFGPSLETPVSRRLLSEKLDSLPSAMKGVVLTSTGEPLETPAQCELAKLFIDSPKVGLDFAKIFDKGSKVVDNVHEDEDTDEEEPPPSPCGKRLSSDASRSQPSVPPSKASTGQSARESRLRRPSLMQRLSRTERPTITSSVSDPCSLSSSPSQPEASNTRADLLPTSKSATALSSASSTSATLSNPVSNAQAQPQYNLEDAESLPSPFLKRVDHDRISGPAAAPEVDDIPSPFLKRLERAPSTLRNKKSSNSNQLLKAAATRAAKLVLSSTGSAQEKLGGGTGSSRPSVANARKAGEEARKALRRP